MPNPDFTEQPSDRTTVLIILGIFAFLLFFIAIQMLVARLKANKQPVSNGLAESPQYWRAVFKA